MHKKEKEETGAENDIVEQFSRQGQVRDGLPVVAGGRSCVASWVC
jgi:hypothetical protein